MKLTIKLKSSCYSEEINDVLSTESSYSNGIYFMANTKNKRYYYPINNIEFVEIGELPNDLHI